MQTLADRPSSSPCGPVLLCKLQHSGVLMLRQSCMRELCLGCTPPFQGRPSVPINLLSFTSDMCVRS